MLWLAEDHCIVAQSAASRDAESRLDLYVRMRGLQSGAHAEPDAQHSSGVAHAGRGVSERRSHASFGRSVARKHISDARKLRDNSNQLRNCPLRTIFSAAC